jgi:hypothetical protein
MNAPKVGTVRPSRAPAAPLEKHVEKASREVKATDAEEKQLKVIAPVRYHKGMADIKNMTTESVPVKHLMLEALDDLFEKYTRGDGHFKVDDLVELRRRLESHM